MRQLIYLVFAGFIGAASFYGIQEWNDSGKPENNSLNAVPVNSYDVATLNFVDASVAAKSAVVSIYASESEDMAQRRYQQQQRNRRSPFDSFFGNEWPFNDFFGQHFYPPREGAGSGVILTSDGYIVTNNHVVGFADDILVTTPDGKQYKAEKIGTDPSTDLAVIKIDAGELSHLDYGDSDKIKVGEWVLAVGNPYNLNSTVTAGIVSAKGRDLDIIKGERTIEQFIQTDAAVNPGNSGGALVDVQGRLIGINTAISTPTGAFAGYSFAIPSNLVKKVVAEITESGKDIDRRVSLGIAGYDIDEELIEEYNLQVDKGFYVDEVENRGAAQMSGILPGDVVIGINGHDVDSYDVIKEKMKFNKVGDDVELKIDRQGSVKNIRIKLRKGL